MNTRNELEGIDYSPWHKGERQLQTVAGVAEQMEQVGKKVIRSYMPDQHRDFYHQLPFLVAGVVDPDGNPWSTILARQPGFISAPDDKSLDINAAPPPGDPARAGFAVDAGVGFLGIELHTRRRNRVNGKVSAVTAQGFSVAVEQTIGNCPSYIAHRNIELRSDPDNFPDADPVVSSTLSERDVFTIRSADSFYVASYTGVDTDRQVDVSHRGGKPGFVNVSEAGELTIPDFSGNKFFNTLGNILTTGKAGLIFIDYETGGVLQMTGKATVLLDAPEINGFAGAERLWTFKPDRIVRRDRALPLRWDFCELSPSVIDTGSWEMVQKELAHESHQQAWRPMRVVRITDESSVIRSFHLEPADGSANASFLPGQHLPIRLTPDKNSRPVVRNYTLSSAPGDPLWRISVKREHLASTFLHDQINVGDIIEARKPQGQFSLDPASTRPAVLLAGGVGITPMISMTREIVAQGLVANQIRPVWLFQASRTRAERAFDHEFGELIAAADGSVRRVRAGTAETGSADGDLFHAGRIDIELLKSTLPFDDYEFYLCGPPSFMQSMYDALQDIGVRDDRIFAESFGPASLKRTREIEQRRIPVRPAAQNAVVVNFKRSGKQKIWNPEQNQTLLDLAEASDLAPEYSCRAGNCGTCRTRIVSGAVTYAEYPAFESDDGEALICCAVPAQNESAGDGAETLTLDL